MIRLYTDPKHYNQSSRKELIALLRPFIDKKPRKGQDKPAGEMWEDEYELAATIQDCDIAVLPMSWNYYYDEKKTAAAWDFIRKAAAAKKKVISWTSGDFGITPPYHEVLYVFRPSGYDNHFPRNHKALPIFLTDPVKVHFKNDEDKVLNFPSNGGVIGFCGLANPSAAKHFKEWITIGYRNLKYRLKVSRNDPQEMISSTGLRCRMLDKMEKNKQLKTNFIRRDKYRAGSVTVQERTSTAIEYFDNILHSDFILCVRGNGNFSVRFYECFAMGRIPLLVNTHSPLPDISPLRWDDYLIMVNPDEIDSVHEKIAAFLRNRDIMQQRKKNRELFLNYLTNEHFWKRSIAAINNKS